MSKQLKFKFKKTLKKAEFVHADLEYHQELISEAKKLFSDKVRELIGHLSEEDQKKIKLEGDKKHLSQIEAQKAAAEMAEKLKQIEEEITDIINDSGSTALTVTESEANDNDEDEDMDKKKALELKKLWRRIAEQTHPDKVMANGFSAKEVNRLERVFKKALQAYNDNNWYVLYSIALDLNLKINDPTQEHIGWIEDDIRNTLGGIAKISNQISWVWYVGDINTKLIALQNYFSQAFDFTYPDLKSHIQN